MSSRNLIRSESRLNRNTKYYCHDKFTKLDPVAAEGAMPPNGPAIGAVSVTGEAIRLKVPVASKERVPVASYYGAVFAITVREGFITIAVQADSL
jgi:hypothetical protein